jgi:hypothetical protein
VSVFDSFWSLACENASATAKRRFLFHYEEYAEAVCQQAKDRDMNHVRSISDYLDLRRNTIGAKPSFDLLLLPLELPDYILDHPIITELVVLAIDMIILANVSARRSSCCMRSRFSFAF